VGRILPRLKATFWQHSLVWRRPARRLRLAASVFIHRVRVALGGQHASVRLVSYPAPCSEATRTPLVAVVGAENEDGGSVARWLARQTETSVAGPRNPDSAFFFVPGGDLDSLPATHLESMVLAAVAEDLDLVAAGMAAPAGGRFGPSGEIARVSSTDPSAHLLLRRPDNTRQRPDPVIGRSVAHITPSDAAAELIGLRSSRLRSGPYLLRGDTRPGTVLRHPVRSVFEALASTKPEPGPPTVLFLLPYLAVGGAEQLLFDLLQGLEGRYRSIVVTLEPHMEALGQTVDVCRSLTPHVYTLGDWLPREAQLDALRHLIRRWSVQSLVSWNGTVAFYDHVTALRAEFPALRILNQLYNHRGAWIERYTAPLVEAVDTHIAVNRRIAEALEREREIAVERIATIYHAVELPELPPTVELERRRRAWRRELGVPEEAVVVGTFIRMHRQKRPLDLIRLARRMVSRNLHFLMVGGGPMDAAVDRELASRPTPNLTRLAMRRDTRELLEAVDLCLMTSEYEGLPIFLLEGMARGLPAVATEVGDIPYLLEEGGGQLAGAPGNLDALEHALETLLDDDRRTREGRIARSQVAARFGLDRYVEEYESVIFPP
jgi:glycosyltransferase involved in cell wall biosynthesis